MAKSEEYQSGYNPVHRIVGAVIVVSLGVIFIPMILNKDKLPPKDSVAAVDAGNRDVKVVVTSLEEIERTRKAKPAAKRNGATLSSNGDGASNERASKGHSNQVKTKPAKLAQEQETKEIKALSALTSPKSKSVSKPVSTQAKPSKSKILKKTWVVQLGTYADPDNANRVKDRLAKHGYVANLENVRLKQGKAVRVRVGPFEQKVTATSMQARIQSETGLDGVVLAIR